MPKPPFASLRNLRAEGGISGSSHDNILASSVEYVSALAHFTGAIMLKAAEVSVESIREAIDKR